mgnify:CR=1 FL=1
MDVTELLATIQKEPAAAAAKIEEALQAALAEGGEAAAEALLEELYLGVGEAADAENLLKALDAAFRRHRESELGRVTAWQAGYIAWKTLNDVVRAEFYMRAVGGAGPHSEEWREFYRVFYASRGNWLRLEQFLGEVAQQGGMSPLDMKRTLARTAREFENPSKELSYWQAMAQAAPGDPEADQELERLYTKLERWPSLADLYKERLKTVADDDVAGKTSLLLKMIAIYGDRMKAEPKVLATYQMILDVDPANGDAIDALLARYEAAGRWPDYAKVLVRKIDATTDTAERIRLREVQANLMEVRFANALEALKAYEQIHEMAPERQDIIDKLKDLYEKRRDFESLIKLRRAEAERLPDHERAAVFVELAMTATERLRKFPLAIELWEKVLEIEPTHGEALKALEALYEREKHVDKQCEILQKRHDLATDDTDRVAILEKLAGLYGTKLGDANAAMQTWRRILDVNPGHDRAKRELRARYLAEHKWDDLDWFLRKFGTVEELARTLESQVGAVTDPAEKRALLVKLAGLWRDELNQPARAVKNLEQVLSLVPDDLQAATDLISLYRGLSDWRRLPPVYDVAIAGTAGAVERRRLMIEAAEVHEKHLGNAERSFFWYLEAFKEDLRDDTLRDDLERLAGPSDNWEIYAAVLEQAGDLIEDESRKVRTFLRVGQIHTEYIQNAEAAQTAFQRALDLDPGNREAIHALEVLYRQFNRYEALIEVLRKRLVLERRSDDRLTVRFEIARTLYGNLQKVGPAVETYEEILADNPAEAPAYQELGELLLAEKRFGALRDLLVRQVGAIEAEPAVQADVNARIGMLSCGLEGPSEDAVARFARALELVPGHADSLAFLEDLLGVENLQLAIIDLLKGPFEASKRWADLADLLEIETQRRGDGHDTVPLLWRLDELYVWSVPDAAKRFRTLSRILAVTPDDPKCWDAIEACAGDVDGWRELSDLYGKAVETIAEPSTRVALSLRLARIEWDRLGNVDQARKVFLGVLELDDANADALEALETIIEEQGDHPELLKIYRRRFEVSPYVGEKIAYAFKVAAELSEHLDDVEGAIAAVKQILDLEPESTAAYRQLDSLYIQAERWYDLAQVLVERIRLAETEAERTWLRLRLAEVREEKLEDVTGAVEVYRTILQSEPTNEDAVKQLERLFKNPDVRVEIARILLPAYEARHDDEKLVEVYEVLAEAAPDLDTRLAQFDLIAITLETGIGDLSRAFAARARAFRAAPDRQSLVDEVLRVGGQRGALGEAVDVLCEKVFEIDDPDRRKETHRTIARVARDGGLPRTLAKRHFGEVLAMDDGDLDALDALVALHREDDEIAPLVSLLLRKSALLSEAEARVALLLQAGDLQARRLDQADEAIKSYSGVLEIEPGNRPAIEALEGLYESAGKHEELVEVLGRKAEFAPTTDDRVAALKKKGLVQHERLGNTGEAIETFLQVHGLVPENLDALRTLDRLYAASEDWWNLYGILGKILALVQGEDALTVRYRMGRLLEKDLSDPVKAVDTYETLLIEFPENREAVDALEGMVRAGEASEEAFKVLAPVLSERNEWERLYVVYEVITEREEDVARKVTNLLTMGEIAENRVGRALTGFECYGKAFTTDPLNHEALDRIEHLAADHDMWENVPALMLEGAKAIEGNPESLALRLRAASVQRDKVADREAAALTLEGVIEDFPDNRDALSALDALYLQMEQWKDLARILRAEIDASPAAEDKVAFLLRLAAVAEDRQGKDKDAFEARCEVLYLVPAHAGAVSELRRMFDAGKMRAQILEVIEPIYRETGAWTDLATVYESVLAAVEDPGERKSVLLKLGEVELDKLLRRDVALGWFGKALAIEPADESLLIQIEGLAAEAGEWASLLEILLAAATTCQEDERRIYLWHKAADVARDRLGDRQRAEAVCRWILDVDASDRKALADLDGLYEGQERWADLLGILEREAAVADYDDDKIRFGMRAGALLRDRLNDLDGAVEAYAGVLKSDEMHRGALEALAELHDVRDEHKALYKVLGTLADIAPNGHERAGLQRRMARLAEDRLSDREAALSLWDEVSRVETDDRESLQQLQRLHAAGEDWTAYVDACEREISLAKDLPDRMTDLLRSVAKASETQLADAFQAQQAWRRVLEVQPDDLEALQALRRLYRDSGDLEALSGVLTRLADGGRIVGDDLKVLCEEHARLLTDELGRNEGAITWWNRVMEMEPSSPAALEALDRLYEDTGRLPECVAIVKRRATYATDTAHKAELLVRAAEIEGDRMKDAPAAAATLEEVAGFDPANLDVSQRLQMLYQRIEDWDRLADVLLRRDGILKEAEDRVSNLQELARVYENRKNDRDSAFIILVKASEVNPADETTLADLWRLAQTQECWRDYVDSIAEIVDRMPDALRQEHLLRCGEILADHLHVAGEATRWFERVIEKWPESEPALVALTRLYEELDRKEDLVGNLTVRVGLTPDYLEKVALQLKAGKVLAGIDAQRALAAYQQVLEFDDANVEALTALSQLHEGRGEWEDLLGVLGRLASLNPAEEVLIRVRMAGILEEKVKDPNRAIQAWEDVLSLEATHSVALDHLQNLYGSMENWKGLAAVYERLLDLSSSNPDRILFCNRLAVLFESALDDKARALSYWQQILDIDPEDDEAFETCARLLTELEDWNELVNLLEGRVIREPEAGRKAGVLRRIADVYEKRLEDLNSAVSVYQRILDIDPGDALAYADLSRLFEAMESWEDVVQTLLRWKEHVEDTHETAALMLRAATIVHQRLENPDRALKLLGDVLRLDPGSDAAAERMRQIYGELEDWEKVAEIWLKQEAAAARDEAKAKLRASAGDVFMNRLKDRQRAIQHYERALELDPRLPEVALSLAQAYVAAERWEKAEPLLEMLLKSPEMSGDGAAAAEIHFQMGLCAERLLDFERAFREYQVAVKARADHAPTAIGLARLYPRKSPWQLAKDHYVKGLSLGGDAFSDDDKAAVEFSLGEVSLELGELDDAVQHLDTVLQLAPNQARAVDLQIAIAERREDWPAVIRYKQAQSQAKADPFERFSVLLECGDIYREKMGNIYGATAAYKEALEINPNAKVALLRLFDLYVSTGAIEDALYVLERLAQAEDSPEKRAKHYVRMGAIYREKLGDDARAIEYLNLALDADPDFLDAFRAIDEILTANKDWEAEAENYRRMLERLKGRNTPELEFRLYAALGEIYRSRLKRMDYAVSAFSMAAKIKPNERRTHEILAQLYEVSGDQLDKAIDEHRAIVAAAPLGAEVAPSYKAMRRLFLQMKEFDKAFMTASVLVALGQADAEEKEFFEGNLEPGLPWFKGTIDPLRWESHLIAKSENTLLGRILQVIYQGVGSELGAKELKDVGLKKKDEIDIELKLLFVNVYKAVSKALGPMPHKVYRDDNPSGLKLEFLAPPALIVGSDMLTGHDEREVAFYIGRQLSFLHPMHFLAAVKNLTELKIFLAAALKFSRPDTQIGAGADIVLQLVRLIERRMPQQQKNQLAKLVEEMMSRDPSMDFGRMFEEYFRGLEATALRAGVLVSGNVQTVLNILRSEEVSFSGMSQKDRLDEIIRFTLSEDHFVLRRALGVAVEAS